MYGRSCDVAVCRPSSFLSGLLQGATHTARSQGTAPDRRSPISLLACHVRQDATKAPTNGVQNGRRWFRTCRSVSRSVVCVGVRMVVKSIRLEDPYKPFRGNSRCVGECRLVVSLPANMFAACRWSSCFFVGAEGRSWGASQAAEHSTFRWTSSMGAGHSP